MVECKHQKLKQVIKFNNAAEESNYDRFDHLAVITKNTNHQSLKNTPTEHLHRRIENIALGLKFSKLALKKVNVLPRTS